MRYKGYTGMRFHFDERKSRRLRADQTRGIGFEEAVEMFLHPHGIDGRSDAPEQLRAIGWVRGLLYSVVFEIRSDDEGAYYHLVTPWKATKREGELYEENT
jgi:uncharacterized DUF497 family protein